MKYIITEDQLDRIKDNILTIPYSSFNNNWDALQKFLNKRGNPPYIINGDVILKNESHIESLGSLIGVNGILDLLGASIKSLGNLTHVHGFMILALTPIEDLGNLTYVGDDLYLNRTPLARKYTEKQIRNKVNVRGQIKI